MVQPIKGFSGHADGSSMRVSKEISKEKISVDRTAFHQKMAARCHGALPTDAGGMMQTESREPDHEPSEGATSPRICRNVTMKTRTGRVVTMKTYRNDQDWITEKRTAPQRLQDEAHQDSESMRSSNDIHSFITDEVHQDSMGRATMPTAATDSCTTDEARLEPTELSPSTNSLDNILDLVKDYPWADDPMAFPGEVELKIAIANLRQEAANREIMKRLEPIEVGNEFLPASSTSNQSTNVTDEKIDLVKDYPWADDPKAFPGEAELKIAIANLRQEAANREILKRLEPRKVDGVFLPASPSTPNQLTNVTGRKAFGVGQSARMFDVEEVFEDEHPYDDKSSIGRSRMSFPPDQSTNATAKKAVAQSAKTFESEEEFEDEDPYFDQDTHGRSKIQHWLKTPSLCLLGSLMVAATVAYGLWYIILSKTASTEAQLVMCSLCHDGSMPDNLDINEIGQQTCSEYLEYQAQLKKSDPLCTNSQMLTWRHCGCPTLPPLPDTNSSCQLCPDGSPVSQFCKDYMTFLVYTYDVDNWCDAIIDAAINRGCTCPQTKRPRDPLEPEPWDDDEMTPHKWDYEDVNPHKDEERPENELSEPVAWEKIPGKKCSFCYDGSIPQDLHLLSFDSGNQTCTDYRDELEALDADDEGCRSGQALTWLMCDCPSLPPAPEQASCSLCGEGVNLANKACEDINTFMAHASSDEETCDEFKTLAINEGCTCPSSP